MSKIEPQSDGVTRRGFLATATASLAAAFLPGCSGENRSNSRYSDPVAQAILSYMASPHFSGKGFCKLATGVDAELVLYDLTSDPYYAYFSVDKSKFERAIGIFTRDPGVIEKAVIKDGKPTLGGYVFNVPTNDVVFRFPASDFVVDPERRITKHFGEIQYDITLRELSLYLANKPLYGGDLYLKVPGREDRFCNHGAFVAVREPSLERLVGSITRGKEGREEKVQALLDFVTEKIRYDFEEATFSVETLKRPNEVLLCESSDCSGKTILFASLLEQLGEDYILLVWFGDTNHIAVGVRQGNFRNNNGYALEVGGERYILAECTSPGFIIGKSRLSGIDFSRLTAVQLPGSDKLIPLR
ncbi:MAG: hypothetical protein D6808_01840 [Candidatus Dadabacteria bacterium]|nr:MAG: hypothetical protein D6808_01840 [Candidatus Dadabacteria bacterium]